MVGMNVLKITVAASVRFLFHFFESIPAMSGAEDNAPAPRDLQVEREEVTVPSQASASAASGHAESGEPDAPRPVGKSALLIKIQKLRADQQLLQDQRKILAKNIKGAQKKKKTPQTSRPAQ